MNRLIEIMASDMGIRSYMNEEDASFGFRVIYSALGQWCLKSALSEKEHEKGISKSDQSILLHNLLDKYVALCPEARPCVFVSKYIDIAVFIRNLYEQTGYLLTKENNRNILNNSKETVRFSDKLYLYLGVPEESYTINGLGIHVDRSNLEISLNEFLVRDSLTPDEYLNVVFDECDFDTKDIDLDDLDALTGAEFRRKYIALKKHYDNPMQLLICPIDEEYSHIRILGQLPNREYYYLLMNAWPKKNLQIGTILLFVTN